VLRLAFLGRGGLIKGLDHKQIVNRGMDLLCNSRIETTSGLSHSPWLGLHRRIMQHFGSA
jgi:hypothetical protein